MFRAVAERLRRLLRLAEESAAEPAAEPAEEPTEELPQEPTEEPRILGQPRLLGRREFVPYEGPRYAPYDPELE